LHVAPWLVVLSQDLPQPPQLDTVDREVSQPSVSGAEVSQSAHPG
jgi:hypothetical protein